MVHIFSARMVYNTQLGNISKNWNNGIKIGDSKDIFMVASILRLLISYGFAVVSPSSYNSIPVCPLSTKLSDLKNSAI